MESAKTIFSQYLRKKGMLYSKQREQILDIFLKTEKHPAINNLYDLVRKKNPKIGLATIYRTMEVICDAGLARKLDFGDGTKHYENKYKHPHHHHLICLKCGKIIEITSGKLEEIQRQLAKKHGFTISRDTMKIFGICKTCRRKEKS
ncbi:MAG: transcriptional repressor [Sedimentisphaerales bacterium]|nr:transcriptional repressor [Sedimentisphaerales bacterium]